MSIFENSFEHEWEAHTAEELSCSQLGAVGLYGSDNLGTILPCVGMMRAISGAICA